jgi:hypothetical protein
MLLCRGGNHRFILRCIVWLSEGRRTWRRVPLALTAARHGREDGPSIALPRRWVAAATLMAGWRPLSLLRGGGEGRRPTSSAVLLGGGGSLGNALHSLRLDEQIVPRSARVNTCCKLTGICQLHRMTGNSQERTLIKCFALIAIG